MQEQQAQEVQIPQEDSTIYEAPAIIYEGTISTRAGSPTPVPDIFDTDQSSIFGS